MKCHSDQDTQGRLRAGQRCRRARTPAEDRLVIARWRSGGRRGAGAFHILCFGHDQVCNPNANGSAGLNVRGGVSVNAGDAPLLFTFAQRGTYEVTCTVHPHMNVIVTVK